MDERAAIVAQGRTLVPNDFVVELSTTDSERLRGLCGQHRATSWPTSPGSTPRNRATHSWDRSGSASRRAGDLAVGLFRIRSGVIRGATVEQDEIRQPVSDVPAPKLNPFEGHPRLLVSTQD